MKYITYYENYINEGDYNFTKVSKNDYNNLVKKMSSSISNI